MVPLNPKMNHCYGAIFLSKVCFGKYLEDICSSESNIQLFFKWPVKTCSISKSFLTFSYNQTILSRGTPGINWLDMLLIFS